MRVGNGSIALFLAACALAAGQPACAETLTIGIGVQDATTNTATTGVVIRELKLLEKRLPKGGKYEGLDIALDWRNFASGPPITKAMMAGQVQFGAMGDYPLVINGYTFQDNPSSKSELIAVAAYNLSGSGNGILVRKDSDLFSLADLKGKVVSVPFGSAAHGMLLKAMQDAGLPADFFSLVSQTPEVGAINLAEGKIDAHADFVPFAELLPFRGVARKVFDGAQTNAPTWHGVVVRTDFAQKYPEIVEAYLQAVMDADDWVRDDPKRAAEMIAKWTGIDREVVYIFLGPGGVMTLDPTIKQPLVEALKNSVKVLQGLNRMKQFDVDPWVNDGYIRAAFKARGLDYDARRASTDNYEIWGYDAFCRKVVAEPRKAGEIWVKDGAIQPYASASCTLGALQEMKSKGVAVNVAYVFDALRGLKLFADKAFYVSVPDREIAPFMLKQDAESYAAKSGGAVVSFEEALIAVSGG